MEAQTSKKKDLDACGSAAHNNVMSKAMSPNAADHTIQKTHVDIDSDMCIGLCFFISSMLLVLTITTAD